MPPGHRCWGREPHGWGAGRAGCPHSSFPFPGAAAGTRGMLRCCGDVNADIQRLCQAPRCHGCSQQLTWGRRVALGGSGVGRCSTTAPPPHLLPLPAEATSSSHGLAAVQNRFRTSLGFAGVMPNATLLQSEAPAKPSPKGTIRVQGSARLGRQVPGAVCWLTQATGRRHY